MTSIWTLGQAKEQRNKKEDEEEEKEKARNNTDVSSMVFLDYTTN